MNFDRVNEILAESTQDDWVIDDETGSFTYKDDLNLRIQRAAYETYSDFKEPWANSHPDPKAVAVEYVVKYGASFVKKYTLVLVDGHRATLPMPKSIDDLRVSSSEVNFARIVNIGDRVDEYLGRSNLRVEDDE